MGASLIEKFQLEKQTTTARLIAVLILLFVFTLTYLMSSMLIPFVLAIFAAYLINPVVLRLEKEGMPSFLAVLLPLLLILGFIILIVHLFYSNISSFIQNPDKLDPYINNFQALYQQAKQFLLEIGIIDSGYDGDIIERLISESKNYLVGIIGSTTSFFGSFVLFILYLFFILPGIKNFSSKINRAFPRTRARKINTVHEKISFQVQNYIKTKAIVSFLTGFLVFFFCSIFGVDFPIIWGVLTFVLNFVPHVGSLISSFFPISLAIFSFNSTPMVLLFSACLIGTQFGIGNILEPKMLARSLSLSPLVVLLSLFFWGWLWGIVGVILSVPIMAAVSIICQNIKPLRPLGVFMQSSSPVREDMEKLSLTRHIMLADGIATPEEEEHIKVELRKEISDERKIEKLWRTIKEKPLRIQDIYSGKEQQEKIDLYLLACNIALLDAAISPEENDLLTLIRSKTVGDISPLAAKNIHILAASNSGFNENIFPAPAAVCTEMTEEHQEQVAHSFVLLGEHYFASNKYKKSIRCYRKALKYYLRLDMQAGIVSCQQALLTVSEYMQLGEIF